MIITKVRVLARDGDPKFKAVAAIYLDDCFVVREIKVIQGQGGLFISMPSRKNTDGTYSDIAHPITSECRRTIEDRVLEEYRRELERVASGESQARRVSPPFESRGGDRGGPRRTAGRERSRDRRPERPGEPAPTSTFVPPAQKFEPAKDITLSGSYGPDDPPPAAGPQAVADGQK